MDDLNVAYLIVLVGVFAGLLVFVFADMAHSKALENDRRERAARLRALQAANDYKYIRELERELERVRQTK